MAEKHILVYAARHGTTELNAAGCFRGHADVELDKQGIKDAHQLAFYFKDIDVSRIFCSDKKRAHETAKTIAREKGMTAHPTSALHPWDVGEFSGEPKDEENLNRLEEYIQNPDEPIPDGEALNDFKARVRPILMEAIELGMQSGEPVLLVAHSSVIHEIGSMLYDDHVSTLVEPGGVVAIYATDGELHAEPIFKPKKSGRTGLHADTIS